MLKSVSARIAEFVEYHIHGDGECNNAVLKEWVRRRNLSLQERYELAFFFSVTYCVESAVVMFEERSRIFADIKGWAEENKARLVFQSDRKYIRMKDSFERVLVPDGYDEHGDIVYKYNETVTFEKCQKKSKDEITVTRV